MVHARIQKIFSGFQILRRGLTENFNMAKINNLAIPGGGGGGPDPLSPVWIRPCGGGGLFYKTDFRSFIEKSVGKELYLTSSLQYKVWCYCIHEYTPYIA